MLRDPVPTTVFLKDYSPPAFLIDAVELDIDLHEEFTRVRARLQVKRNAAHAHPHAPLTLDGDELALEAIAIDGRAIEPRAYVLDDASLTIAAVPDTFVLETVVRIEPRKNTKLMGLFASKDGFFTQCEAEGFRRITFFIDRPDVMARYVVTIHADKARYPVLLSNGNPSDSGDEAGGRHFARWEDPFPKPSYLFAMVAAKLEVLRDTFTTRSGSLAKLAIYVEPGKLDQCAFAMSALKSSMKWDEEVFGLELDLSEFMIVAVGDFNMGAMENKGLNIFNTKYILARPDTATDTDYLNIDRVVAHEYFHNWTGNRVTCRDWFQLSLKEGLTVFRDQEYAADRYSRAVQRIQEVRSLRAGQFAEDAGPMAHPVRPQSYMEISNFYTATVYEKGAEVVRMMHTLLGPAAFRAGMDLYFARHDGQAVTTDDFAAAMADAANVDLAQFKRWYDQAGTPLVAVTSAYDAAAQTYTLTVRQSCVATPGQAQKLPFHIPFAVGLVDREGRDMPLRLVGERAAGSSTTRVLSVREPEQRFEFMEVPAEPVPSLLRDFSAPVKLEYDYSETDLTHLMAHDTDHFNRWEAGQRLATDLMLRGIAAQHCELPSTFVAALRRVLRDADEDSAFAAEALSLPGEAFLAEQLEVVDPDAIHAVRRDLRRGLVQALGHELAALYRELRVPGPYSPDAASAGKRALRNVALGYLAELEDAAACALALEQFRGASNMTDALAALAALANIDCPERAEALQAFYDRWQDEALVVDKWIRVQSTSQLPSALEDVKRLIAHPAFSIKNPNKVYALLGGFGYGNHVRFHAADGAGYAFMAERVLELDRMNPQVAARMARTFDRWRKLEPGRRALARRALEHVRDAGALSKDVSEVVSKTLGYSSL